jgi:hypothetical protein
MTGRWLHDVGSAAEGGARRGSWNGRTVAGTSCQRTTPVSRSMTRRFFRPRDGERPGYAATVLAGLALDALAGQGHGVCKGRGRR